MNILAIFNTCGILPGDRTDLWINNITSILNQKLSNDISLKVVLSDCLSSSENRQKLQNYFGNQISYSFINDVVPIEPSFNKTALETTKKLGNFDGYMYIESGIELYNLNTIDILCSYLSTNQYAMLATVADTDVSAYPYLTEKCQTQDCIIPVGESMNLHCQMFSGDYFRFYNRLLPDIFAGFCMESVLSFCCAAIQKQWIIVSNAKVRHTCHVDGQSIGFRPDEYVRRTGIPYWNHPYVIPNLIPIFTNPIALKLGLGYEEYQHIVMHDQSQYNDKQHCINEELKEYIKNHLFLNNTLFDYDKIQSEFII